MRLAYGLEEPIGKYLSAHFPELMRPGIEYRPNWALGLVDDADTLFGAIGLRFDAPWDGQASIYVEHPRWLSRSLLRHLFHTAFDEMGLARLTCTIAKGNRRARRFVERIGWKLEGVKRKGFDGRRDACVYGMTREDCRWLGDRDASTAVA